MDPVTKAWKRDDVIRWFSEAEAKLILNMPISHLGCPDKLLRHFTKHGNYTVKLGYELVESLHRNGELNRKGEGECSNQKVQKSFWKGIWSLKCEFARAFWFACPFQLDTATVVEGNNFAACWTLLKRKYAGYEKSEDLLQLLAYGFWRIWKCRNPMVFQGLQIHPSDASAEVDAICAVLIACQQGGFALVMVESDSLIAIQMVKGERLVDAEIDCLTFDIQAMTREFQ
ncbi:PREDICTED: LOC110744812 [Prunus dulcis]|uniref:PREDICTED: LOC110744812 n=1 Tax=Prunus dulcis TaxID=3755 RepID=A0A5E4FS94_PRUDU|nr:hypothetical protein L3X38_030958 [Prunus dulcis]VVA30371.1 PREDICTED: LOC110744812 [Prunus dulcis]